MPSNTEQASDLSGSEAFPQLATVQQLANQETNETVFGKELCRAVKLSLDCLRFRLWRANADRLTEIALDVASETIPFPPDLLSVVVTQRSTHVVSAARPFDPGNNSIPSGATSWVLVPIVEFTTFYGIVAAEIPGDQSAIEHSNAISILQMFCDASLPFFKSRRAREFENERRFDRQFQEFCSEVHTEPSLDSTPATIAVEFQRLFSADRNWFLLPSGGKWRTKAAGGIPSFQRRAAVVRKLEKLVSLVARTRKPFQWSAGQSTSEMLPRVRSALDLYLDESHVVSLRVEPLFEPANRTAKTKGVRNSRCVGIVVCEWFQPVEFPLDEFRWNAAVQQSALSMQNASDWNRAPVSRVLRRWRRTWSWRMVSGWGIAIAGGLIGIGYSALLPMEFTIEAIGELQPVRQRHVFAATSGIVREIATSTGADVSTGQTLIELDSPELELEIRRTEGELQTTEKRIVAIEASRLDFGASSAESANQMNSMAGELKEQRQRRENLQRELELLDRQREKLKVISPIKGRVVTWDLERLLLRRPVSRGQRLLTVSDIKGPWEALFRINDNDTTDLNEAIQLNPSVTVEFVAVTIPDRIHFAQLGTVSQTVEVRSPGEFPSLLCRATAPESIGDSAIEGMSIRGRIHCGRRPAYVVLLTKLWRSIREHILFPWGL